MKTFQYKPVNVCSQLFEITVDDNNIVTDLKILGGCHGNLQGISSLVKGMNKDDIIAKLEGIKCRGSRTRETSCPDQIAKALKSI